MITGDAILNRVQTRLIDEAGDYWARPELEEHLAASFNAIIIAKPDAHTRNEAIRLAEGALQELPADGYSLMDVRRNMGPDGITPGRVILEAEFKDLDRSDPMWMSAEQSDVVENYAHDSRDPRRFYVYPPMSFPPQYVDVVYSAAISPRYTDPAQPIPLPDVYEDAIFYYVLAQAYGKNSKRGDLAKMSGYMQQMMTFLGNMNGAQAAFNADTPPGTQQQ